MSGLGGRVGGLVGRVAAGLLGNPIPLLLGGVRRLWGALGAIAAKINAQGWVGLVVAVLLWAHFGGEARHWRKVSKRQETLLAVANGSVDNLRRASYEAADLNRKQIDHIEAARKASDERIVHARNEDIGSLRDLAARGRLRPGAAADQSAAASAKAGAGMEPPCRAIDPTWLCVAPEIILRSAENEANHDRLIDAVESQAAIDPNKP